MKPETQAFLIVKRQRDELAAAMREIDHYFYNYNFSSNEYPRKIASQALETLIKDTDE